MLFINNAGACWFHSYSLKILCLNLKYQSSRDFLVATRKPGAVTTEKAASGKVKGEGLFCPSYALRYHFHSAHSPLGPAFKVRRFLKYSAEQEAYVDSWWFWSKQGLCNCLNFKLASFHSS